MHIVGQILKDTIQKKRLEFVTVEDSGQVCCVGAVHNVYDDMMIPYLKST